MPTLKLVIEYAGTRFSGWQEQKAALTVAGELRRALAESGCSVNEIGGAGRTDAGVHAVAQTAHVRLAGTHDPAALLTAVNERLPADINVLALHVVDDRFHARHHAVARSYVYQIARRRTAFAKRYVWWVADELDLQAMRAACVLCVGEHDFARFCERPKEHKSTQVRVDRAEIACSGSLVLLRFEASHFLWRMVRRLTGALVQVGRGGLSVEEFQALLAQEQTTDRRELASAWTAPASGLFLESVRYDGDEPLPPLRPMFSIDAGAHGDDRELPSR
ncbi:MAG: tRNA pseudouridine(38-40) synthase TruA [Planctomycetes bacterium]|nr:tRNA pseudouridine(38-40) synthase TruA [Planctomycetota bacterium]